MIGDHYHRYQVILFYNAVYVHFVNTFNKMKIKLNQWRWGNSINNNKNKQPQSHLKSLRTNSHLLPSHHWRQTTIPSHNITDDKQPPLSSHHWRQTATSSPHITEDKPPTPHLTSLKTSIHLSPDITEDKPPPPRLKSLKTNDHPLASHHWRQTTIPSPNITEDKQPPLLTSLKTNHHLLSSHHWRQITTSSPHITEDEQPPPHLTSLKKNNHPLT